MMGDGFEVFQMAGVGQAVEVGQEADFGLVDDMVDEIRADEARPAGDE